MSAAEELVEMRARWAARPKAQIPEWRVELPTWLGATGNLLRVFEHWPRLYTSGEVIWGRILQANHRLFVSATEPSVAEIVWSEDPFLVENPGELDVVCQKFHDLERAPAKDGPLQSLSAYLKDEFRPAKITRLPAPFCAGRVVWHAMVVVYPTWLPTRRLRDMWVPIVRDPAYVANTVAVLPERLWAPSLVRRWEQA